MKKILKAYMLISIALIFIAIGTNTANAEKECNTIGQNKSITITVNSILPPATFTNTYSNVNGCGLKYQVKGFDAQKINVYRARKQLISKHTFKKDKHSFHAICAGDTINICVESEERLF